MFAGRHVRPAVHERLLPRRPAPGQHLRDAGPRSGGTGGTPLEAHLHRLRHDGRGRRQHAQRPAQAADRGRLARRQGPRGCDPRRRRAAADRRHGRARAGDDAPLRRASAAWGSPSCARSTRASSASSPSSSATWCGRCRSSCRRTSCSSSARCRSPPGVCSALDPQFNLWDSVEPYAAQLLRDERGNVVQDVAQQALEIAGRRPAAAEAAGRARHPHRGRHRRGQQPAPRAADRPAGTSSTAADRGGPVRRAAHRRRRARGDGCGVRHRADGRVGRAAAVHAVRRPTDAVTGRRSVPRYTTGRWRTASATEGSRTDRSLRPR